MPEGLRAWRLGSAGVYAPWPAEADGRYRSTLGLSFAPERPILRWYDPQGRPLPTNRELGRERDAQARRIAVLEAELRRLRGE